MLWVERYEPSVHQLFLLRWLRLHSLPSRFVDELPEIGFFVWEKENGVAAGFLRSIEKCNYCLIDSFITNPEMEGASRHEAMDFLTKTICEKSKALHYERCLAFTEDEHTRIRALKWGFTEQSSQKVLVLRNDNERNDAWVL